MKLIVLMAFVPCFTILTGASMAADRTASVDMASPISIHGEINQPGSLPYQKGLTVSQVAALAGGYTKRADLNNISIQHSSGAKEQPAKESTPVLPGDTILVEERRF